MGCVLCKAINEDYRVIKESDFSFSIVNMEPLKDGHVMILPKRHVTSLNDLTSEESLDLLNLVYEIKEILYKKYLEDMVLHMNFGTHST